MRRHIPDENLARAIVASARGNIMGVLRYFRVGSVDFDWNSEDGVSIKADLQNYWTPTYDPNAQLQTAHRGANHADRARAGSVANPIAMAPTPTIAMSPLSDTVLDGRPGQDLRIDVWNGREINSAPAAGATDRLEAIHSDPSNPSRWRRD